MKFRDIYDQVEPLWKTVYSLDEIDKTISHVRDIRDEYQRVENYVETHDQFNKWHELLVFTMYQAITRIALDEYKKRSAKQLKLDDITIDIFEKYFHDNLMANGNEEYLEQYKGYKKLLPQLSKREGK